jgi:glycosyltransferase involved in cell wall biosynthesis
MSEQPLVSVGIPTYNRPAGLRRVLECITTQTYQNLEIIVSDNASSDSQVEKIALEFASRDGRIKYYRQEENRGAGCNFKFVLEQARGEYFIWAADDDCISENYISTLLTLLIQNRHLALAGAKVVNIESNGALTDASDFDDSINHLQGAERILSFLSFHRTGWIYGLHRIEDLKTAFARYMDNKIVASDRLFLYFYVFNSKIAATNRTIIYKQNKAKETPGYRPRKVLPYILWSLNFLIKALQIFFSADISLIDKAYIFPHFIKSLFKLLYSSTFFKLIKTTLLSHKAYGNIDKAIDE